MNLVNSLEEIIEKRRSVRIYDTNAPFDSEAVVRSLKKAHLSPNSSNMQLWEFYHIQSDEAKHMIGKFCMGQNAAVTANELVVFVTTKQKWKERAKWNLEVILKDITEEQQLLLDSQDEKKTGNALKDMGDTDDVVKRIRSVQQYYTQLIPNLYRSDSLGLTQYVKKLFVAIKGRKQPFYREVSDSDLRIVAHKSCALAAQTFMLAMTAEGYGTCPMEGYDSKRVKEYLNLPEGAEINMIVSCGVTKPEGIYGKRYRVNFNEVYRKI